MAGSTFQTNPVDLHKLLEECHRGIVQCCLFQVFDWDKWQDGFDKHCAATRTRASG
jgi:hypothetical protein